MKISRIKKINIVNLTLEQLMIIIYFNTNIVLLRYTTNFVLIFMKFHGSQDFQFQINQVNRFQCN